MNKPRPILGIDFGTTNTSAAWFDRTGKLRIVPVGDKSHILPSVVWYPGKDKFLVGVHARQQIIDDPKHTVFGSKRFLGRRFQSEFVSRHKDRFAFELVEWANGTCAVKIYDQVKPLTEVAFHIIQQMVTLANHAAGEPFEECVLTVPAHASFGQRQATREAAERTGIRVRAIVNEPTASALYYANLRNPEQTVLVFDLGGGTFDATLLSIRNRVLKVLATGGDAFLGGANFDEAIVRNLVQLFERQHGINLEENKVVMQRLLFAAESAKIALSGNEKTQMRVPVIAQHDGKFIDFEFTISRPQLEQWCFQLIERTAAACDDVLKRAGMTPKDIDEMVMVGGQTRTPAIQQRFALYRKAEADRRVHPELGVAVGAAVLGRNLQYPRGVGLADVVPVPIGIMRPGLGTQEVIGANTPVPCTKTIPLQSLPPKGSMLIIGIYEALEATAVERELLGTVRVGGEWRAANPGTPTLEMKMGEDFSLSVALIAENGQRTNLEIMAPRSS
jgi:molecular chaperone DnaK